MSTGHCSPVGHCPPTETAISKVSISCPQDTVSHGGHSCPEDLYPTTPTTETAISKGSMSTGVAHTGQQLTAIQFVSRGQDTLHQLRQLSLRFPCPQNTVSHRTLTTNWDSYPKVYVRTLYDTLQQLRQLSLRGSTGHSPPTETAISKVPVSRGHCIPGDTLQQLRQLSLRFPCPQDTVSHGTLTTNWDSYL